MSQKKSEIEITKELDTTGLFCPEPLLEVKELNDTVMIGQCFKVLADDPETENELKEWAKDTGTEIIDFVKNGDLLTFTFRKKN
ncbi:MAG: sulfurtransferase TusA family protein [Promethearchaeota archaeon]|nr:MAG: sulfurtransferase TusA family protein [Candidatus Lokiarchaeota archaeon]